MILDSNANHIQRNDYSCNRCKVNNNEHNRIWYLIVKIIIYSVTVTLVIDVKWIIMNIIAYDIW